MKYLTSSSIILIFLLLCAGVAKYYNDQKESRPLAYWALADAYLPNIKDYFEGPGRTIYSSSKLQEMTKEEIFDVIWGVGGMYRSFDSIDDPNKPREENHHVVHLQNNMGTLLFFNNRYPDTNNFIVDLASATTFSQIVRIVWSEGAFADYAIDNRDFMTYPYNKPICVWIHSNIVPSNVEEMVEMGDRKSRDTTVIK